MNHSLRIKLLISWSWVLFLSITSSSAFAQTSATEAPLFGAEIFIEPGQTPEQIDTWFKRLKEAGMTITRIRLFERYMRKPNGAWDFTLFDQAYKAGEKYGIKIYGNLFPATPFKDIGGFKFPRNEAHLASIATYIKGLVTHFKQFKSCYGWVPINEPGAGELPKDAYTTHRLEAWKKVQPVAAYKSKGYEHFDFAEEKYLLHYNTWFLNWLTTEVRKYDKVNPVHVNTHAIFGNVAEYNFPEWRKFLTSLGGSAHASWHFYYFNRPQYAVALSANSEIIRSGAGNIPWMMTELQGGNNTYSGNTPLCPTKEEITQWLWITLASEGKGAIFWCLNPRSSGIEAGEWAMLDFGDKPTDRLQAATNVIAVVNKNSSLFANSKVVESGINILYTRESLWNEKKQQSGNARLEGRSVGGVMKSALAYFEALSEMGVQSNFKEISEFDFSKTDYSGQTIILAHQPSIPSMYWQSLQDFISKGGKLIVDGLTAFYDENAVSLMNTGFPLETLFGGAISEFKATGNLFKLRLNEPNLEMPAHLWRGSIVSTTAKTLGTFENEIIAVRNSFGKGEVVWMPSLVGMASRMNGDYSSLAVFLTAELTKSLATVPIRFKTLQPKMLMKTIRSGDAVLSIVMNKSGEKRTVDIEGKNKLSGSILFADKGGSVNASVIHIAPEETIVIRWN